MKKEQVRVSLLGSSFTIQTGEDPAYLNRIIRYLHEKIEEIRLKTGTADPLKIAILSGIFVTDELFKAREGQSPVSDPDAKEAERITLRLIETIDEILKAT